MVNTGFRRLSHVTLTGFLDAYLAWPGLKKTNLALDKIDNKQTFLEIIFLNVAEFILL